MKARIRHLSEEQKDCQSKANLYFADAHSKAKSLRRISTLRKQRLRIREVLSSLKEGLEFGQRIKRSSDSGHDE